MAATPARQLSPRQGPGHRRRNQGTLQTAGRARGRRYGQGIQGHRPVKGRGPGQESLRRHQTVERRLQIPSRGFYITAARIKPPAEAGSPQYRHGLRFRPHWRTRDAGLHHHGAYGRSAAEYLHKEGSSQTGRPALPGGL